MKTEFLKGLNLSQEVIDKIMAENGKDIAAEQKKAEAVMQERDSYKLKAENMEAQVSDANAEIQRFKDMDVEGILWQDIMFMADTIDMSQASSHIWMR